MKIETFKELLRKQNPEADAWISKPGVIAVIFQKSGLTYKYHNTVVALAQRLGLIPEINVSHESMSIADQLMNGSVARGHIECVDTVRYVTHQRLIDGNVQTRNPGTDEFGRKTAEFYVTDEPDAWV